MFSRRTLFARLSAVALAPLVKLVPKPEPHVWSFLKQPGRWTPEGWKPYRVLEFYPSDWVVTSPTEPVKAAQLQKMVNNLFAKLAAQEQVSPVPQEEA